MRERIDHLLLSIVFIGQHRLQAFVGTTQLGHVGDLAHRLDRRTFKRALHDARPSIVGRDRLHHVLRCSEQIAAALGDDARIVGTEHADLGDIDKTLVHHRLDAAVSLDP